MCRNNAANYYIRKVYNYVMENMQLYNTWKQMYATAKDNMRVRKQNIGILIEVAAQHPLVDGNRPNEEFEKRLLLASKLYVEMKRAGNQVWIYVPGSIHMYNGITDKISLSEAGKRYLMSIGINEEDILADEMNVKYKGAIGVYNSTDECYVASRIFEDLNAGEFHCVCSSGQTMRKMLSYIHFGYVPYIHTVSCDNMYHDYIDEVFKYIPIIIQDKDVLQCQSDEADRLRKLRKPMTLSD